MAGTAVNMIFRNDAALIDYVQQIAGISAIGMVNLEALVISYGEGSNGKSTFWNAVPGHSVLTAGTFLLIH